MTERSTSSLIHEVNLLMDRIADHKLQDALGISYSRFIFLFTVKQYDSSTQHQIAQALKVSDPAVSKLCAEAVRDDLIHITPNPLHKRQRLVELTASGRSVLQKSLTVLDDCFSDMCARAQIDEPVYHEQTMRLLNSLNDKYKKIMGEP